MKIRRLRVRSYRGISELDTTIGASGAIVRGGNGRGKTSVLRSLRAALSAQDIAPDAIKQGADKAEILVDLDDHTVRRVITAKGSTLTVEKGGMKASKPQTYLAELFGTSAYDPLDFFLAKPKDRKAIVLAATPATVTREQIAKYIPATVPALPLDFSTEGHGLEVLERARAFYYAERTAANKEAADAKREADRLSAESTRAASAVTPGALLPIDEAKAALSSAQQTVMTLETRAREAAEADARTAAQRSRIDVLRAEAADMAKDAGAPVETAELEGLVEEAADAVRVLEEQLASSRAALEKLRADLAKAKADNERHERTKLRAADLLLQADTLASAIAAAVVTPPSEQEMAAARAKVTEASATVERAALQAAALAAIETAKRAAEVAAEVQTEADDLDAVVKRLANDAPAELLSGSSGIPGLSIAGDDILLDGKRLDALCGSEQMRFAVEIARRANEKTKVLLVDGLERLDPDQTEAFVADATRGGYQLLCTKVDRGDVVIEAITSDADAAAAAE